MWTHVLFAMLCLCSAIAADKQIIRSNQVVQARLSSQGTVEMPKASFNSGHNAKSTCDSDADCTDVKVKAKCQKIVDSKCKRSEKGWALASADQTPLCDDCTGAKQCCVKQKAKPKCCHKYVNGLSTNKAKCKKACPTAVVAWKSDEDHAAGGALLEVDEDEEDDDDDDEDDASD